MEAQGAGRAGGAVQVVSRVWTAEVSIIIQPFNHESGRMIDTSTVLALLFSPSLRFVITRRCGCCDGAVPPQPPGTKTNILQKRGATPGGGKDLRWDAPGGMLDGGV